VLVEFGKLDEARKNISSVSRKNPNDTRAAAELEYVRGLKTKQ